MHDGIRCWCPRRLPMAPVPQRQLQHHSQPRRLTVRPWHFAMVGTGEGWDAVSVEVHEASDAVQQLRETCHDMRQPVGSVFALVAAALAEPGLPDAARDRLKLIVGQAEWLADMIDDFLHASRREADQTHWETGGTDLTES